MVVCLDGWHDILKAYAKQYNITKLGWVISGGETGHDSIYQGLMTLGGKCADEDIILIHDSIRPMVSQDIIADCIAKTMVHGCAIPIIPCAEAILLSDDGLSSVGCIDRDVLKRTQTPQGFRYKDIRSLYNETKGLVSKKAVAPCTLMVDSGKTVYFSKGSEKNIKITTVEDIDIFKALLSVKKEVYLKDQPDE